MKLLIKPGWVMGLLALLVSPYLKAQLMSSLPLVPDTVYYPYHNGVQMIEIDHIKLWNIYKSVFEFEFEPRSSVKRYHRNRPLSNEYFFRNKEGKIVQAFNTHWNIDSLQNRFVKDSLKQTSHLVYKVLSQDRFYNDLNLKGHYIIFNAKELKVQHKQVKVLKIIKDVGLPLAPNVLKKNKPDTTKSPVRAYIFHPFYYSYDTTKKFINEYPYRFKSFAMREDYKQNHILDYKKVRYGLIDSLGNITVPVQYQEIFFRQGFMFVKRKGKWGVIDKNNLNLQNQLVIPCEYESIYQPYNDRKRRFFIVKKNRLQGLMNNKGQTVIPCEYQRISFDNKRKLYLLEKDEVKYKLNKAGKIVKD